MTTAPAALIGTILQGTIPGLPDRQRGRLGRLRRLGFTWDQLTQHLVVIGGTGTGKTVTLMRLAAATKALNRAIPGDPPIAVIFLDAKGLPTEDRDTF